MRSQIKKREDWSAMTIRQRFGYFLVRYLGKLQQLVYHRIIQEPVWRCADGKCIPISQIGDNHLRNIILMLSRNGEQNELLNIFNKELTNRYAREQRRSL